MSNIIYTKPKFSLELNYLGSGQVGMKFELNTDSLEDIDKIPILLSKFENQLLAQNNMMLSGRKLIRDANIFENVEPEITGSIDADPKGNPKLSTGSGSINKVVAAYKEALKKLIPEGKPE